MAQRVNPTESKYTNYLPACVKCKNYQPGGTLDPYDDETRCAHYGEIPAAYLLMSDACEFLSVETGKEFIDMGDRPLTMRERHAIDDAQWAAAAATQ